MPRVGFALALLEVMDDLVGDFALPPELGVYEYVGLSIKRFSSGEQRTDFFERLVAVQQGSVGLVMGALPDGLG